MSNDTSVLPRTELTRVDQGLTPRGRKILDWGVEFATDSPDDAQTLDLLLATFDNHDFGDNLETLSLQYQWFKDEGDDVTFNFFVFRETGDPINKEDEAESGFEGNVERPSRTPGPPTIPPPLAVAKIDVRL